MLASARPLSQAQVQASVPRLPNCQPRRIQARTRLNWVFHSNVPDCASYWDGCEREQISSLVDAEGQKVVWTKRERLPKHRLGQRTTHVHGDLWILERRDTTEDVSPRTQFVVFSVTSGKPLWRTVPRYEDVYHSVPKILADTERIYICEADASVRVYTHDGVLEGTWGTPSCGKMHLIEGQPEQGQPSLG